MNRRDRIMDVCAYIKRTSGDTLNQALSYSIVDYIEREIRKAVDEK